MRNSEFVLSRIASADKKLVLLDDSYHVITVDRQRDCVARELQDFIAAHTNPIPRRCFRSSDDEVDGMSRRRVVITGLGVVSSIGLGKEAFWRALLAGQSGIKRIRSFDASLYPSQIAGEISDFPAEDFFPCGASAEASRASH